jgi:hypothetical protein
MTYVTRELCFSVSELASLPIQNDAAPVFVIDANRMSGRSSLDPRFDNRWIVYPQDFPSGAKLREHGITRIVAIQQTEAIAADLNDVLVEWQTAGLEILTKRDDERAAEVRRHVKPPSRLLVLWRKLCDCSASKRAATSSTCLRRSLPAAKHGVKRISGYRLQNFPVGVGCANANELEPAIARGDSPSPSGNFPFAVVRLCGRRCGAECRA